MRPVPNKPTKHALRLWQKLLTLTAGRQVFLTVAKMILNRWLRRVLPYRLWTLILLFYVHVISISSNVSVILHERISANAISGLIRACSNWNQNLVPSHEPWGKRGIVASPYGIANNGKVLFSN